MKPLTSLAIVLVLAGTVAVVSTTLRDGERSVGTSTHHTVPELGAPPRVDGALPPASRVEGPPPLETALTEPWLAHWNQPLASNPSPERNAALATLLEDLATRDPLRARDLALAERDEALRHELLRAVLAGWASVDIEGAGRWALAQNHLHTDVALAAVFHGGRAQPEEAVRYARELSTANPARTGDVGHYLISALGAADEHQRATAYAVAGGAFAKAWLTAAYSRWSRQDPETAVSSATALADPEHRRTAFRAAIVDWAKTAPRNLLPYAVELPPGEDRDFALVTALRAWAAREPEAAAAWIAQARPINGVAIVLED